MARGRDYITAHVDIRDAEVDIDVDDLSDEDIRAILDEAGRRGMHASSDRYYVELAMEALLRGRHSEAIALLDRALYPYPMPGEAARIMKGLKQLPLGKPEPKEPSP